MKLGSLLASTGKNDFLSASQVTWFTFWQVRSIRLGSESYVPAKEKSPLRIKSSEFN